MAIAALGIPSHIAAAREVRSQVPPKRYDLTEDNLPDSYFGECRDTHIYN